MSSLLSLSKSFLCAALLFGLTIPAFAQDATSGAHNKFRWPLRGPIISVFTEGHDGIDIAAAVGEWVHAAADGVCIYAGDELKSYGKLVLIRHADGYVTAYADNSELEVKEGDEVKRGQIIAKSGDTGDVASPRLHFELRKDGKPIDPTKYLVPL